MAEREEYLLELSSISKSFKEVKANDNISLKLSKGEVLALLGENGAGKSTLMNIIYGIYKPDSGKIFVNGKEVKITSPKDAMSLGIGMVHQHFMLIGRFNAIENIILISEDSSLSFVNKKKVRDRLEELKAQYEIDVDIETPVEQLSISMQQKVEILKLLYRGADILILDEPTAVLLPRECLSLFKIIMNMTTQGKGVIFISHKLNEVLHISDRINVLSLGKITGEIETKYANNESIITMMSGKDVVTTTMNEDIPVGEDILMSLKDIEAYDDRHVKTLKGLDLELHTSEIIGIAGVEGNGQEELSQVIAGVRKASAGTIIYDGKDMTKAQSKDFISGKIGYIPSDRNHTGTIADFSLYQNWLLRKNDVPKKRGLLDRIKLREQCKKGMQDFDVRAKDENVRSANLSGGNLQKFILAREMESDPKLLICSYPTRGLDVKASWFVRNSLIDAKRNGTTVVVFSSDLEELFAVSDRIVVLYDGKVVGEKDPKTSTNTDIVYLMMGGR